MVMRSVFLWLQPSSDLPEVTALIDEAYIIAARDEALGKGCREYVAWGDEVLEAILAVMWVAHVTRVYTAAVSLESDGALEWLYGVDCRSGKEVQ